jgi:hypothetical protein
MAPGIAASRVKLGEPSSSTEHRRPRLRLDLKHERLLRSRAERVPLRASHGSFRFDAVSLRSCRSSRQLEAGGARRSRLHFTGWTPPTVASFVWYGLASFAGFKRRVLIVSRGATVNAAADVLTRPSLSVAVTRTRRPCRLGVPAIVPVAVLSATPLGKAPEASAQCRCRFHPSRRRTSRGESRLRCSAAAPVRTETSRSWAAARSACTPWCRWRCRTGP